MNIGDLVVRKSYGKDVTFKIIDIMTTEKGIVYTIKGINLRVLADSLEEDLELVNEENSTDRELALNRKVSLSIKKILSSRQDLNSLHRYTRPSTDIVNKGLTFGRPGRILHIDGDPQYLEVCLKVYKQLALDVVGKVIPEAEQPNQIIDLIKLVKPDIVVLTGHDAVAKDVKNYTDLTNYRNSKYFVEAVTRIRDYEPAYDDLVIFAGACQSCYEAILDAGANFASSPNRVLIHCLDPVFVCEKIAYANIEKVVPIQEALSSTITGTKGIGGLQTRGKYREGFPKSQYI